MAKNLVEISPTAMDVFMFQPSILNRSRENHFPLKHGHFELHSNFATDKIL